MNTDALRQVKKMKWTEVARTKFDDLKHETVWMALAYLNENYRVYLDGDRKIIVLERLVYL
jgi:hypothetical protein